MWIWPALVIAPALALADQAIAFSLVNWCCAHQSLLLIHLSHLIFLFIVSSIAIAAGGAWLRTRGGATPATEQVRQAHFLAGVAAILAALSALAVVAMWIPTWMVSACIA
jgi:hypothetical protein